MRKRTYGTGSFRQIAAGKYEFRYRGKSTTIEAASDKQADRALRNWVDGRDEEEKAGPKLTMSDILDLYLLDHRKHDRVETPTVEKKIKKYIRPRIGALDAAAFSAADMDRYSDSRRKDVHHLTKKAPANATLNREISIISHGLRLAAEKLQRIVFFGKSFLREAKPRQGITSEQVDHALLLELPDYLKALWCFAYYTGVRSGQLKKLRREWMDWEDWVVRCPGYYGAERIYKERRISPYSAYARDARIRKVDVGGTQPKVPPPCFSAMGCAFAISAERSSPHVSAPARPTCFPMTSGEQPSRI